MATAGGLRRLRRVARLAPVLRDAVALAGGRLGVAVLGWLGTVVMVRALSPAAFGQYSLVFGVLGMLAIITNSMAPRVALRGLTGSPEPEVFFGGYVVLRSVLGVVAYGAALGFVVVAGYPPVVVRATALGGLVLINVVSNSYTILLTVRQELHRQASAQLLGQLAQLGLTVVLAIIGATVTVFTIPVIVYEVVILVYLRRQVRQMMRPRYVLRVRSWLPLLAASVPIAVGEGMVILYQNVDSVMLSKLQGFTAVAVYNVGSKFTVGAEIFPMAVTLATVGVLVKAWPERADVFYDMLTRVFLVLFTAAVAVSFEFPLFARPLIAAVYGGSYARGALAASLVVGGACMAFFSAVATTALVAQGRNRSYMLAGAAGLVFNVVLNLVLIPLISYNGAGVATLASETAVTCCQVMVLLRGAPHGVIPWASLGRCVIAGLLGAGAAVASQHLVPWPAAACVGLAAFLVAVHALRVGGPGGLRSFRLDPTW
jgi:O-antigen/teichoic acid export membrane protein